MERRFSGTFGKEHICSGSGGDSGLWVIPGGDSAPTKMTTHLGDSRSEAEHHRNLWAELRSVRAESPAFGRSLRPAHSSTMLAKPQVSNGTEPEVLGGTFVPHAHGGDSGPRGGDSAPRNILGVLRAEIPV